MFWDWRREKEDDLCVELLVLLVMTMPLKSY